ncbi:MAG TPA: SDR family oxidoreductase [Kribbella sp.]|nr:SDR family oxidoreductase [Kribbella sp.]
MAVLVLGATGKTGRPVVEALVARGIDVRAASRHPGPLGAGVEPVRMDWSDPASWKPALRGVDGLYLVGPYAEPDNAGLVRRLLAAATGVRRVVHLSIIGVDQLPMAIPMAAWEQDVRESSLEWTILRPNWFFQNFEEGFGAALRERAVLELPAGDAGIGFIDTLDVAEVAATLLSEGGHGGQTYTLTGPEALTLAQAVAELGRAAGSDLRYHALVPEELADRLTAAGAPGWAVEWQLALFRLIREGLNSQVTDTVEAITGQPARPLSAYADRQAHNWRRRAS